MPGTPETYTNLQAAGLGSFGRVSRSMLRGIACNEGCDDIPGHAVQFCHCKGEQRAHMRYMQGLQYIPTLGDCIGAKMGVVHA